MIGAGLLGAVFGVAYGFTLHSSPQVVMLLGFLTEVMIMGFGGVSIATYVPELFPTEVRATGGGFAVAVGRVASAVFPFAVVAVFHHLGAQWVFLMIAAILLLGVIPPHSAPRRVGAPWKRLCACPVRPGRMDATEPRLIAWGPWKLRRFWATDGHRMLEVRETKRRDT